MTGQEQVYLSLNFNKHCSANYRSRQLALRPVHDERDVKCHSWCKPFKCHHDQILYNCFYFFVHSMSFLDNQTNFNVLRILQLTFFWTFISENLRSPLIFLVQNVCMNWRKRSHFVNKINTRVEIIKTISTACTAVFDKNLGSYIRAIFNINCYYN